MVRHFLKDGTEVKSIAGTVIKREDFETVYRVIEQIEKRKAKGENDK